MSIVPIPCAFCNATGSTDEGYVCGYCEGTAHIYVNAPERNEDTFALSVPIVPHEYPDEPPSMPIVFDGDEGY